MCDEKLVDADFLLARVKVFFRGFSFFLFGLNQGGTGGDFIEGHF